MGQTTLYWKYDGLAGEAFRIYRSDSPMNPLALPTPVAEVAISEREYVDSSVIANSVYYYRVGVYQGAQEIVSAEIEHRADTTIDPYWSNVVSLLRFEGTEGGVLFLDDTDRNWFAFGNARTKTDVFKFGASSGYFDGSGDYIASPYDASAALETQDFTIEGFLYPTNDQQGTIITNRNGGTGGWLVRRETNQSLGFYFIAAGSVVSAAGAVPLNTWTYYRVDRDSSGLRLYINSTLVASSTTYTASPVSTRQISIGATLHDSANYRYFQGYIDSHRITAGISRPLGAIPPTSDFIAGDVTVYQDSFSVTEGAWTWFNDARAIVTSTGQIVVGIVSNAGVIKAAYASSLEGPFTDVAFTNTLDPDDHDNPSFIERSSDGRILASYARHNDPKTWLRTSTNINDASSFGSAVDLTSQIGSGPYSYSNLVEIPGDGIFNFFRKGSAPSWTTHFSKSTDNGATWSSALPLISTGGRPYFKCFKNGSRIEIAVTDGHPDSVSTNSVYHCYYEAGSFYDSFGSLLGTSAIALSSMTKVFDGSTAAGRGWVWDIVATAGNDIAIAVAAFPTTTDHRYIYCKFDGTSWTNTEICEAGSYLYAAEPYYSAGFCIDPDNINTVYTSIENSGSKKLSRFQTSDNGATWVETLINVQGSKVFRPFKVKGSNCLLYLNGDYTSFTNYTTYVYSTNVLDI